VVAITTDGFLLVDKPAGVTSQDVVTAVRHALPAARAGHTGTLDPFATGLLVILVDGATRLARFVPGEPKTYEAEIRFGSETDSDDATGAPTAQALAPDESAVREAMARLTGALQQIPPAYSAKQVDGERSYALARAGRAVPLAPVRIVVHAWEVLARDNSSWRFRISCGGGTYIRALARDLGRLSASAAHLGTLRRTRIGPFEVTDALTIEQIRQGVSPRPAADALAGLPRAVLAAADLASVRQGRAIDAPIPGTRAALLDEHGALVAVAERLNERWHPTVVLHSA